MPLTEMRANFARVSNSKLLPSVLLEEVLLIVFACTENGLGTFGVQELPIDVIWMILPILNLKIEDACTC